MDKNGNKADSNGEGGAWWQPSLVLFAKLSGWIAVPIISAAFIGRMLDNIFSLEPWLFLFSIGFSFIISMFGLVKEVTREYKKIEKEGLGGKESTDTIDIADKKVKSKK